MTSECSQKDLNQWLWNESVYTDEFRLNDLSIQN